jgi:hypothetical protein
MQSKEEEMISAKHLYDNGLPFSSKLDENLDDLKERVLVNNKAALIIIDGAIGEGKTTLAVHCADYLAGGEITFKEQLAMGGQDFTKKLRVCFTKKYVIIIYDEAGDFNRRGSLTRFNAMLNRVFETYRAFKIIVILSLPLFAVLDNDIFDKQIPRLLIHCFDRRNDYGDYKAYSLYRMLFVKDKMQKLTVKTAAYGMVEPNFRGHFKDLPPIRRRQLDLFSTKGKFDMLELADIQFKGLLSYDDIAKRLAKSVIWVKQKTSKLQITHKKIYKKKKYFDNSIIDRLVEETEK